MRRFRALLLPLLALAAQPAAAQEIVYESVTIVEEVIPANAPVDSSASTDEGSARFIHAQPAPVPRGIAAYGPFRVLDAGRAALVDVTDTGSPAAFAAMGAGLAATLVYEYCHCIQHLNFQPKNAWLIRIKTLHMAHHFHNETGNFGIISFWPDRLLGTLYEDKRAKPRSPTVFNLGYDAKEAQRYPWVAAKTQLRENPQD